MTNRQTLQATLKSLREEGLVSKDFRLNQKTDVLLAELKRVEAALKQESLRIKRELSELRNRQETVVDSYEPAKTTVETIDEVFAFIMAMLTWLHVTAVDTYRLGVKLGNSRYGLFINGLIRTAYDYARVRRRADGSHTSSLMDAVFCLA